MGKKDYERYIKTKIMSENAPRYLALLHLVHFPYMKCSIATKEPLLKLKTQPQQQPLDNNSKLYLMQFFTKI
jgi:hypothetical protein